MTSLGTVEIVVPKIPFNPRILDDDPVQLDILSAVITEMGYEPIATQTYEIWAMLACAGGSARAGDGWVPMTGPGARNKRPGARPRFPEGGVFDLDSNRQRFLTSLPRYFLTWFSRESQVTETRPLFTAPRARSMRKAGACREK